MLGVILLVLAFLLFAAAGLGQTLLEQPPADLVAWGLACVALALLVGHAFVTARFHNE